MKTNYVTLFFLTLATLLLAFTKYQDTSIRNPSNAVIQETNPCSCSFDNTSPTDTVYYEDAHEQIQKYKLWQRTLPDSCKWDPITHTITYMPKKIECHKDIDSLDTIIHEYKHWLKDCKPTSYNSTDPWLPYVVRKNVANSYFIPLYDIQSAVSKCPYPGNVEEGEKGVRIHLAAQVDNFVNTNLTNTHVLITPASRCVGNDTVFTDYILRDSTAGKNYMFDLTTPCPQACPKNTIKL